MARSTRPAPRRSIASQMAASATIAAANLQCARIRDGCSPIERASLAFSLEFHPGSDADRPGLPGHDQSTRATAAGSLPTDIDALVEDVRREQLDAPLGPVQAGEQVDQRRRTQTSLEHVRLHLLAGPAPADLRSHSR